MKSDTTPLLNKHMNKHNIFKCLIAAFLVFLLAAVFNARGEYQRKAEKERQLRAVFVQKEIEWQGLSLKLRREIERFRGVSGVVIKDMEFGFEFAHNENELFPSASISKVPIMAAAYKAEQEGVLDLSKEVELKDKDKLSGSGALKAMPSGKFFTVEELIKRMISESDNTATNMITNILGLGYINSAIESFGLTNSRLSRKVADYTARGKGLENYTTARDMASILDEIYDGRLVSEEASVKCMEFLLEQKVKDRLPRYLPAEVKVAHKTGLEKGVCHDVGIVLDPGSDFIICVLTKHSNSNSIPSKKFIARLALLVYEKGKEPGLNIPEEPLIEGEPLMAEETLMEEQPKREDAPKELSAKEMQILLKNKGLYSGSIDGNIGPKTRAAIREFQKISGLKADGVVGEKTMKELLKNAPTTVQQ